MKIHAVKTASRKLNEFAIDFGKTFPFMAKLVTLFRTKPKNGTSHFFAYASIYYDTEK